jgi:SAM-dependent methyltransferase
MSPQRRATNGTMGTEGSSPPVTEVEVVPDQGSTPGHRVFAALYSWLSPAIEAGPVGDARRTLLTQARGVVADLGAGAGVNLAHLGPDVTHVHLIEPDPHMLRRLPGDLPPQVEVHRAEAEDLPLSTAGVDTVLATLSLCTVRDPDAVAAEIRRVLRPGGGVLILEHVRSTDPGTARRQDRWARPWGLISAGCRPNRDTAGILAAAGFDTSALRRFSVPGMLLTGEWLTGRLARQPDSGA